ncbi:cysteine protease [Nibricoccus aquaticus]|uniref:Cysteine protease n=1 Tax=Nibricoccus aquaticus TaxID=2576891 RepID=A0A290Q909_9BACT|nr:transglutaminase family protein [Nibricoccus aquaticus]ATC62726.1 cysteine protease [Nibricoccus aquaticus]
MQKIQINHHTRYSYSAPVILGPHRLFIRPREGHDILIASSRLEISPTPASITWHRDVHGNSVATVVFGEPADSLSILSEVIVEHYDEQPLDFVIEDRAAKFPFVLTPAERMDLMPYLTPSYPEDQSQLDQWTQSFWKAGNTADTSALLNEINRSIANNFSYARREEPGVQRPSKTLATQSGSCRDFATLMIETCRFLGLPARFVSGYASTEDIPAALGSTHAWAEVYLPGAGWKGFDSTGGVIVGPKHIAIAVGRDPESLPPISGSFDIGNNLNVTSSMEVTVEVKRQD